MDNPMPEPATDALIAYIKRDLALHKGSGELLYSWDIVSRLIARIERQQKHLDQKHRQISQLQDTVQILNSRRPENEAAELAPSPMPAGEEATPQTSPTDNGPNPTDNGTSPTGCTGKAMWQRLSTPGARVRLIETPSNTVGRLAGSTGTVIEPPPDAAGHSFIYAWVEIDWRGIRLPYFIGTGGHECELELIADAPGNGPCGAWHEATDGEKKP